MKLKKIVSLVLVCILAVSLLSGCGEEKIESTLKNMVLLQNMKNDKKQIFKLVN